MDALYFPYLSLPPATWVNPTLMFFDRLAVIAPAGGNRSLHDRRTRELVDLDMVRLEVPGGWSGEQDRIFLSYLLGRAATARSSYQIARVQGGKLAYGGLASDLIEAGLLARTDDGWLEGPEWAVTHLMSYLALQISAHSRRPMPLITDQRAAATVMVGPRAARLESRRLRAVTRLLPVPPDARLADLARFREQHNRELRSFREYINALITSDPSDVAGDERFVQRIRQAEEIRGHLVDEMQSFDWRDRGLAISILALSASAAPLDHAPWTMAAGLVGLGMTGAAALAARGRRRSAEESPLIYAAKATGRWPATAATTLW